MRSSGWGAIFFADEPYFRILGTREHSNGPTASSAITRQLRRACARALALKQCPRKGFMYVSHFAVSNGTCPACAKDVGPSGGIMFLRGFAWATTPAGSKSARCYE